MAGAIGSLAMRVSADTGRYNKAMRGTKRPADRLDRRMKDLGKRAGKLTAAFGAVGAAITAALVKKGLTAVDAQAKLARQLGTTQAAVAGMTRAADDAGVSQQQLTKNLQALNKRLGEAQEGSGQAADALEKLGLTADDLAEMPVDKRMAAIAKAIRGLNTQTEKAAVVADLFSRAGLDMMNMFERGATTIPQATQEVKDFGIAVDMVDASRVEAANDAMSRIGDVIQGVSNQLAIALSGPLTNIADKFVQGWKETDKWKNKVSKFVDDSVKGLASFLSGLATVVGVIEDNPAMAWGGLVGYTFFGKKGAVVMSLIGLATEKTKDFAKEYGITEEKITNKIIRIEEQQESLNKTIEKQTKLIEQAKKQGIPNIDALKKQVENLKDRYKDNEERLRKLKEEAAASAGGWEKFEQKLRAAKETSSGMADIIRDVADAMRESRGMQFPQIKPAEPPPAAPEMPKEPEEEDEDDGLNYQEKLKRLTEFLATRRELEIADYQRRQEWLKEIREKGLISKQEYQQMELELSRKHEQKLTQIASEGNQSREALRRKSMRAITKSTAGSLKHITGIFSDENKKMFKVNKMASIAQATVRGWEAATSAWAAGMSVGGPYAPAVAAAYTIASLAKTTAQIASIKAQSFSGGGSNTGGGGGGGGGGTAGGAAGKSGGAAGGGEETTKKTEVTISGFDADTLFTGKQVRGLIGKINDELEGGMVLRTT